MRKTNFKKAIILLSGGMDSLTTLAIANSQKHDLHALHLNYGQLTERKELEAFQKICHHYKIPENKQMIIDVSHFSKIGGSALLDKKIHLNQSGKLSTKIPSSYVPFRNAHILCIAVSWGEIIKANKIFIGAVEEDSSGYPDCREKFLKSFEKTVKLGTKPQSKIEIIAPLLHKTKTEIVKMGLKLKAPFRLSWSCYAQEKHPCLKCDSCLLRMRAFQNAKLKDPIL